jgi:hypothetical protein
MLIGLDFTGLYGGINLNDPTIVTLDPVVVYSNTVELLIVTLFIVHFSNTYPALGLELSITLVPFV